MPPKKKPTDLEASVETAIASQGAMPLGWFLVYECLDKDGERVLHYLTPDDLAYWQALGYLYTAIDNLADIIDPPDLEDDD